MQRKRASFAMGYLAAQTAILLLAFFFCASPIHQQKIEPVFLWPAAIALMCLLWYRCCDERPFPWDFFCLTAYVGWVYATCVFNGDPYLEVNRHFMLAVLLGFGAAYPTFRLFDAKDRQRWFNRFAAVTVALTAALGAVCLYCCVKGIQLHVPFCDDVLGLKYGRLYAFTLYPTEAACLFMLVCLLAVYLLTAVTGLWRKLLVGACAACLAFCVSLTVSRTAMICLCVGLGMLAFLLIFRALSKRGWLPRVAASVLALGLVAYGGFSAMLAMTTALSGEPAVTDLPVPAVAGVQLQRRSLDYDMGSFTGRTDLWQAGIQAIKERPVTLLVGMSDAQVGLIPQRSLGRDTYHMHSVWMETLLLTGVPGLLLYLFMAVMLVCASVRLFFARGVPFSWNVLAILPPVAMINGLMEIYPSYSGKPMDLLFFLTAGAVMAMDRGAVGGRASARAAKPSGQ